MTPAQLTNLGFYPPDGKGGLKPPRVERPARPAEPPSLEADLRTLARFKPFVTPERYEQARAELARRHQQEGP